MWVQYDVKESLQSWRVSHTIKLFKSLFIRIRKGLLMKVIFARSSELLILSNSNPSLESQNDKIGKASKGYFSHSLYFTDKETEAGRGWVNCSRSALDNGRDEARFESPNSQSNELSCLFQCSSKSSKYTVASVKHTGGSGSVRLCKVLEICDSDKSSRQFSMSGK